MHFRSVIIAAATRGYPTIPIPPERIVKGAILLSASDPELVIVEIFDFYPGKLKHANRHIDIWSFEQLAFMDDAIPLSEGAGGKKWCHPLRVYAWHAELSASDPPFHHDWRGTRIAC